MTFTDSVYEVVKKIPRGKVMTYKGVAEAVGKPNAARAVGNALNRNPELKTGDRGPGTADRRHPVVPCHRVVRSDLKVGGFVRGSEEKTRILRSEGVEIDGGRVSLGDLSIF